MAGDIPLNEQLIIVTPAPAGTDAAPGHEVMGELVEGQRVLHVYGDRVRIVESGVDLFALSPAAAADAAANVARLLETAPELSEIEALGARAFQLRLSPEYLEAERNRPGDGEEWNLPEDGCVDAPLSVAAPADAAAAVAGISDYLQGSVAVGIIIVDGPTADLSFSADERTNVFAKVQNALSFFAAQNPSAGLTFTYALHSPSITVQPDPTRTGYEPLESLWRDPAMAAIGYEATYDGVRQYAADIRQYFKTDWAYCAFFTKYPLEHFAYARLPRLVMQYSNGNWGPVNIDRVFAHETGHLFGCRDEYGAKCKCGGAHGRWGVPNLNCVNCAPGGGSACVMKVNDWAICSATAEHLGWWQPEMALLSYKEGDGTVSFDSFKPDGSGLASMWSIKWSSGWTILEPFPGEGQTNLLSYKSRDGSYSFDRLVQGGWEISNVTNNYWKPGWTMAKPFILGQQVYLLSYKDSDGSASIDRIDAGGGSIVNVWQGSWRSGWTIMEFYTIDEEVYLLSYMAGGGSASIDRINPAGAGMTNVWKTSNWAGDWTILKPFALDGQVYLLSYKQGDGSASIDRIDSGGGMTNTWGGSWTSGWTIMEPVALGGQLYLLSYKGVDGTAKFDRINAGGAGTTNVWTTSWSSGWTTLKPYAYT